MEVTNREGYESRVEKTKEQFPAKHVVEGSPYSLSSTSIRKKCSNEESIAEFYSKFSEMWPSGHVVEEYIVSHSLWSSKVIILFDSNGWFIHISLNL